MGEIGNDKQVCKDFTFINQLGDELILARKNFPGTKHLIMALVEEVGELSQAMLHYKYENGSLIVDYTNEGPMNQKETVEYPTYWNKLPLEKKFNKTVDNQEWAHIAAIVDVGD